MALTDNLLSYYKLSDATDSVGSNNLSAYGIVVYDTGHGKIGEGAELGNSNYLYLTSGQNTFDIYTSNSISFWLYVTAASGINGSGSVVIERGSVYHNGWNYGFPSINLDGLNVYVSNRDGSGIIVGGTFTSNISLNTWHHIVYVYDSSANTYYGYFDGVISFSTSPSRSVNGGVYSPFSIGYNMQNAYNRTYLPGNIDELGIWQRALSNSEVIQLYSNGLGNQYPFDLRALVTTDGVSSIDTTTAVTSATVTTDSGVTITERGVCWSDSSDPEITDNTISVTGSIGAYTATLTGLIPATTYHVRAYVTNAAGTNYGDDVSFTTLTIDSTKFAKDIDGVSGSTYSVSLNVGGTTGTVTVSLGTTGTSQTFNAASGVQTFQGTYGGLAGLIFTSNSFDGYIDDVKWVLITGTASIDWTQSTLTNLFPIKASVFFKQLEAENFNQFRVFNYLDLLFKRLNAYMTVTIQNISNNNQTSKAKTFMVGNDSNTTSFVKKRISFLSKNQALIIGLSNNNLDETFTISEMVLSGFEMSPKLFKSSDITSLN